MVMSFDKGRRNGMIEMLIDNDIDLIKAGDDYYLDMTLRCGFKGYENYTDDELEVELKDRDISTVFGENDD